MLKKSLNCFTPPRTAPFFAVIVCYSIRTFFLITSSHTLQVPEEASKHAFLIVKHRILLHSLEKKLNRDKKRTLQKKGTGVQDMKSWKVLQHFRKLPKNV